MRNHHVETYIDQYMKKFKPYKEGKWCYEDGIILKGLYLLYECTKEDKYYNFVFDYLNEHIDDEGNILGYAKDSYNIDNINAGKVLFNIIQKSDDKKFLKAIQHLYFQLKEHPRTKSNNFWHKKRYPNQIWLDGLYMAQPFYARYLKELKKTNDYSDIKNQFMNVRKLLFNEKSGLYHHAYDEDKKMQWADVDSGKSPNVWSRAVGWYAMALVDVLEIVNDDKDLVKTLKEYLEELIIGMLPFQSDNGMWFQIVDLGNIEGNYEETSGTLMMAYAILKGVRLLFLDSSYQEKGIKAFEGTLNKYLYNDETNYHLGGTCEVAGLDNEKRDGSVKYYLSEPVAIDEAKGVAPLMMAYSEILKI